MKSSLYKQNILDHYRNPRNFRKMEDFDKYASLNNATCGDEMEVFLKISNDGVEDISFQARGCAISIAAMSMLSEKLEEGEVNDIENFKDDDMLKMLGMEKESPRIKCALLGLQTLKKSLH
jgi:nitrogen fixation protein NifU and related proteins